MEQEASAKPSRRRMPGSVALTSMERDILDHARQIGEIITAINNIQKLLNELTTKQVLRESEDVHIDKRFDRIERQLEDILALGRWTLAAFGVGLIAAIVTFIVEGGLVT